MDSILAIIAAIPAFAVPLSIPLFVQRWRTFLIVVAAAAVFFTWLTLDLQQVRLGEQALIGPLLGGLMLAGFGAGAVAKFVMLIGRTATSETDSTSD
jgi:hypothetical protein